MCLPSCGITCLRNRLYTSSILLNVSNRLFNIISLMMCCLGLRTYNSGIVLCNILNMYIQICVVMTLVFLNTVMKDHNILDPLVHERTMWKVIWCCTPNSCWYLSWNRLCFLSSEMSKMNQLINQLKKSTNKNHYSFFINN